MPTPDKLREAERVCAEAMGYRYETQYPFHVWVNPDGGACSGPPPFASDAAACDRLKRWMAETKRWSVVTCHGPRYGPTGTVTTNRAEFEREAPTEQAAVTLAAAAAIEAEKGESDG